jgi:hypothetical protein
VNPPGLREFYTYFLDEDGNGDAFIAAIEVAIMAELGAALNGVTCIVLEDCPLFPKNDAGDQSFFLAAKQRGAQRSAQSTTLSSRAVAMDDFDRDYAGLFGLAEFDEKQAASVIDGR